MDNLSKVVTSLRAEHSRLGKEMERVEKALNALGNVNGHRAKGGRRTLSKEARERIAEAQRQRWAKVRKAKASR
jgi:hypothetical protein